MDCNFNLAATLHDRCEIPNLGPGLAISRVCPRKRAQWHPDRLRRHSTLHRNLGNGTDPLGRARPKTGLNAWICTFRTSVRPATKCDGLFYLLHATILQARALFTFEHSSSSNAVQTPQTGIDAEQRLDGAAVRS